MKMSRLIKILSFLILIKLSVSTVFAQDYKGAKNLKDSILVHITWDEFKNMSFQEKTDLIRELRGQEPRVWAEENNTDNYGILIRKNIPIDSTKSSIDSLVCTTDSLKSNYKREVFPNSYVDVMNEYFGGMYRDILERTLRSENFKNFEFEQGAQLSWISNFTKRSYYFDQNNNIKLIEIEVAYNINEGEEMKESEMQPLLYKIRKYYFDNDLLKFVNEVNARQRIDKYYHNITQEDLDSTNVVAYTNRLYYYKNNCFLNLRKDSENKGEFDSAESPDDIKKILSNRQQLTLKNWKKELEELKSFETRIDKSNKQVITARNYLLE
jgi:hypothetical protein